MIGDLVTDRGAGQANVEAVAPAVVDTTQRPWRRPLER
jgi:hypothetical protein